MPTMDERALLYLKAFFSGGEIAGGLSCQNALRQSRLDFSRESLERIDYLLDQLRERFRPEPDGFLKQQANQSFLYLLGFYVGMLVAKQSKAPIKWLSYDELIGLWPAAQKDYPPCFATSVSCLLGGRSLFLPLSPLLKRLFAPEPGNGIRVSAEPFIFDRDPVLRFRRPPLAVNVPDEAQTNAGAMGLAGYVAAHQVWSLAAGGPLIPALNIAKPGGKNLLISLRYAAPGEALREGAVQLKSNPDRALSLAFAYDASILLAAGRVEALVVEARSFHAQPFFVMLALPFRPASASGQFAVHQVKLMECTATDSALPGLFDYFYLGAHEHVAAVKAWESHLDESV